MPDTPLTPLRLAFYGRTSSDDAQDPSLSIPRQFRAAELATAKVGGAAITGRYYDIESGRKRLSDRGDGADTTRFNIPLSRDGGLQELLAACKRGEYDAVIVEEIGRVSRRVVDSTRVEADLGDLGVPLYASDEPLDLRAAAILTRRIKQSIAEYYVARSP